MILLVLGSESSQEDRSKDPEEVWRGLTEDAKKKFDEKWVEEEDVEDAVEWARSQ